MLIPLLISSLFVLGLVILCFLRPNAGRIFLGAFFLLMALGVNGSFTFGNPGGYLEYAQGALVPFYRQLAVGTVTGLGPVVFGVLLMLFEVAMGALLLHKGASVRIGLFGTMGFLVAIAPLSVLQIPWLGLLIGEIHLLQHDFESSVFESIAARIGDTRGI